MGSKVVSFGSTKWRFADLESMIPILPNDLDDPMNHYVQPLSDTTYIRFIPEKNSNARVDEQEIEKL